MRMERVTKLGIILGIIIVCAFLCGLFFKHRAPKYEIEKQFNSMAQYVIDKDGHFTQFSCNTDYQVTLQYNSDTLIITDHIRKEAIGFKPVQVDASNVLTTVDQFGNIVRFMKVSFDDTKTYAVYAITPHVTVVLH